MDSGMFRGLGLVLMVYAAGFVLVGIIIGLFLAWIF